MLFSMQAEKKENSAKIPADIKQNPQRLLPFSSFCTVPFYNGAKNRHIHQIQTSCSEVHADTNTLITFIGNALCQFPAGTVSWTIILNERPQIQD